MTRQNRNNEADHEGRIVRLETGLQQVSDTVGKLATVVHEQSAEIREQGRTIEQELKTLAISIKDAAAPKSTDWHLVVKVASIGIVIGSFIFVPLNMRLDWITQQAAVHHNEDSEALYNVREQLQRETELINAKYDREIQHLGERLIGRLNKYDEDILLRDRADLEELRIWRMRSMGLSPNPSK